MSYPLYRACTLAILLASGFSSTTHMSLFKLQSNVVVTFATLAATAHAPPFSRANVSFTIALPSCSTSPTTHATPTHGLRLVGDLNAIQHKTKYVCTKLELENIDLVHSTQLWTYYWGSRAWCKPPLSTSQFTPMQGGSSQFWQQLCANDIRSRGGCMLWGQSLSSEWLQHFPPTTHHWCLSIDPHQMHVAHVTFWNFGIRDEFANRQTILIPNLS